MAFISANAILYFQQQTESNHKNRIHSLRTILDLKRSKALGDRNLTGQQLYPLPRLLLQLRSPVIHRNDVEEEICGVEMLRALEANALKVRSCFTCAAKIHHPALRKQQEVMEHRENGGPRLVDGGQQGTAALSKPDQNLRDGERLRVVERAMK